MTRLRRWGLRVLPLLLLGVLGGALLAEAAREISDPGNSDSIALSAGAHLAATDPHHLYDPAAQIHMEASLLHIPAQDRFLATFTNLAAGAAMLSPLARFDLRTGSAALAAGSVVLFALAMLLMLRLARGVEPRELRLSLALAAVLCIPAVDAIIQWDSLLTAALLGCALLAEHRRPIAAGALLSVLVLKPQVMWLAVPALIAARSWRLLAACLAGACAWVGASVAITGPGGLAALARLMLHQYVGETGRSVGVPSLVADVAGGGAGFVVAGLLGIVVTAVLLARGGALRGRPVEALAAGVTLSLLCAPHVNPQDLMLLALPLAVLARRSALQALGFALAVSAASVLQLSLPEAMRHLEPFVLAAVTASVVRLVLSPWRAPQMGASLAQRVHSQMST